MNPTHVSSEVQRAVTAGDIRQTEQHRALAATNRKMLLWWWWTG